MALEFDDSHLVAGVPNLFTSVRAKQEAADLLSGHPEGAFIVWKLSTKFYVVTHRPPLEDGVAHLLLSLRDDGKIELYQRPDDGPFNTILEFLQSRAYLDKAYVVPEFNVFSHGEGGTQAAVASESKSGKQVRRRGKVSTQSEDDPSAPWSSTNSEAADPPMLRENRKPENASEPWQPRSWWITFWLGLGLMLVASIIILPHVFNGDAYSKEWHQFGEYMTGYLKEKITPLDATVTDADMCVANVRTWLDAVGRAEEELTDVFQNIGLDASLHFLQVATYLAAFGLPMMWWVGEPPVGATKMYKFGPALSKLRRPLMLYTTLLALGGGYIMYRYLMITAPASTAFRQVLVDAFAAQLVPDACVEARKTLLRPLLRDIPCVTVFHGWGIFHVHLPPEQDMIVFIIMSSTGYVFLLLLTVSIIVYGSEYLENRRHPERRDD